MTPLGIFRGPRSLEGFLSSASGLIGVFVFGGSDAMRTGAYVWVAEGADSAGAFSA
jgi:hypothetical protein